MLKKLQVQNFKSILSDKVELGQINVFIGENGSGKSNLLEALAVMSAAKQERLDLEGLYSKGVRLAKPELTFSSFNGKKQQAQIEISVDFQSEKQALITTHNPAILDGLNLNDDDIRLFEIYRNDEGHTKTRRIQLNPETKPIKAKLSELWMRGYLGHCHSVKINNLI